MRKYGVGTSELQAQNAKQIALLKKEGLHVGFPDLMIFGEKKGKGTILFMENKVKGNKTSPYQNACGDWLRSLGFTVKRIGPSGWHEITWEGNEPLDPKKIW